MEKSTPPIKRPKDSTEALEARQALRLAAEEKLIKGETLSQESLEHLTYQDVNRIIHDLNVHQIELEMQNDELRRTQLELDQARARYFDLYDLAPEGYVVLTFGGLILDSNLTAATMLGVSISALNQQNLTKFILKDDQDIYYLHRKQLLDFRSPQTCELRMKKHDGSMLWVRLKSTVKMEEEPPLYRVMLIDITKRKHVEMALAESEEKYKALFMHMDQGFALCEIILDWAGKPIDFTILDINESFTRLLGLTRKTCTGKRIKEVLPKFEQYWIDALGKVALTGEPDYYENYLEGAGKYYSAHAYSLKKNQFAMLLSDIDDRYRKDEKINYLSCHDMLTGLFNRHFLDEEIKRLDTARTLPFSIIMGDVNRLKLINDTLGHQKGDELIIGAAKAIQSGCRSEDLIARWGGDEFMVLLPETSSQEAEKIVERIHENTEELHVNSIKVSISFGIATKISMKVSVLDVIREAENRMYQAKAWEREQDSKDSLDR